MSAILRARARFYSIVSRNDRRFSSPVANETPREQIISSSIISDQTPEPPSSAPPPGKKSWTVLKYGLVAALTGGIATAGYATYAYTLDEIDQKTKALRASANYTTGDDASSLDYVDPVVERLDTKHCIRYRLSRGATRYIDGKHYRDLSMLNRDPAKVIYISGHALESSLQPENCIEVNPWKGEADDTALLDLIPFLEYVARHRPADIRSVLASYQGRDIAKEFIERSKEHQRRMQEQKKQGRLWRH
ncbi:UNVERIFIED_CONTAM: Mitochondrial import inner membrane translocase subunit TIM50 [Sesamum radiatum]|uniref:Mitochondrial import inner membrane translocase subunit TIM50 n=1 Tax=Sesamum radiatum TaxID=300843 RepID=A0AAW2LRR7_SESRA